MLQRGARHAVEGCEACCRGAQGIQQMGVCVGGVQSTQWVSMGVLPYSIACPGVVPHGLFVSMYRHLRLSDGNGQWCTYGNGMFCLQANDFARLGGMDVNIKGWGLVGNPCMLPACSSGAASSRTCLA